jgi:hypothetical protein
MNIDVSSNRLDLVPMTLEFMETSLLGDRASAQRMVGYRIPADWPRGVESTLRFRIAIARAQPETLPLLLRARVLRSDIADADFFTRAHDRGQLLDVLHQLADAPPRAGHCRAPPGTEQPLIGNQG